LLIGDYLGLYLVRLNGDKGDPQGVGRR